MRRLVVVAMATALFGVLGAPAALAQTDATAVARGLLAAENAHNVTAAVGFFAPGAIVNLPTGVFVGPAQIREWQSELAAGNFHADTTPPVAVTPEIVTFTGTVALDTFRSLGISSLESTWQLTIQLGQITTFNFDFTPAATARLQAAIAGAGAATATGAGGSTAAGGGSSGAGGAASTPAGATAGRSLALTGSNAATLAPVGFAVLFLGVTLVAVARRRPALR